MKSWMNNWMERTVTSRKLAPAVNTLLRVLAMRRHKGGRKEEERREEAGGERE